MDKNLLREQLKEQRAQIPARAQKDKLITARIFELLAREFSHENRIFVYVSMGTEVDTRAFIEKAQSQYTLYYPLTSPSGVTIAVKACRFTNLSTNRFGNLPSDCIAHSALEAAPAITLTPLLGFNENCHRIGYGRGCYDRYFANHSTVKIGLAYDEQRTELSPAPHDVQLDYILTPTMCYKKPNARIDKETEKS